MTEDHQTFSNDPFCGNPIILTLKDPKNETSGSLESSSTQPFTPGDTSASEQALPIATRQSALSWKNCSNVIASRIAIKVALTAFPILSGWASVLNAGCTGRLADIVGSDYWSAFFSNLLGTAIMGLLYFQGGNMLFGLKEAVRLAKEDPFTMVAHLGGLFGAVFVVLYTAVPPVTGFGMFFVCAVCGQIVGAMTLDRFGLLWRKRVTLPWFVWLGGVVVVIGTLVFQLDQIINADSETRSKAGYALLGIFAGLSFVVQTSCNVKCGEILGTPFRGSFATFLTGAIVLLIPAFIDLSTPRVDEFDSSNWWPLVSGALSCYAVTVAIILPQYIGFSATFCWAIFGQLTASLTFDALGLLGKQKASVSTARVCGVITVLAGVLLVQSGNGKGSSAPTEKGCSCGDTDLLETKSVTTDADKSSGDPATRGLADDNPTTELV